MSLLLSFQYRRAMSMLPKTDKPVDPWLVVYNLVLQYGITPPTGKAREDFLTAVCIALIDTSEPQVSNDA